MIMYGIFLGLLKGCFLVCICSVLEFSHNSEVITNHRFSALQRLSVSLSVTKERDTSLMSRTEEVFSSQGEVSHRKVHDSGNLESLGERWESDRGEMSL